MEIKKILYILFGVLMMSFIGWQVTEAADVNELENNNTLATAQSIQLNNTMIGTIEGYKDQADYYHIHIDGRGKLTIGLSNVSNSQWQLSLYNSQGNLLKSIQTNDSSSAMGFTNILMGVREGDYYISVSNSWDAAGIPYRLTASMEYTNYYEYENNSTIQTANDIELGENYRGTLSSSSEPYDYFRFETAQDGIVIAEISNIANSEWDFALLNESGEEITSVETDDTSAAIGMSKLEVGLPKGVYYLLVKNSWNSIDQEYTVKVLATASQVYEKEFNNTIQTASAMNLNTTYNGNTMDNNDESDYFKFTLTKSTYTTIQLSNAYGATWTLSLYDAQGTLIQDVQTDNSQVAKEFTEVSKQLKAGDYYVKVYNYWSTADVKYKLSVNISTVTSFKDIPTTHPNYKEISVIREMGIINGYSDGTYRPNDFIKRKNLAAMIIRSGAPLDSIRWRTTFEDVSESHSNYNEIMLLYKAGIIDGSIRNYYRYFNPEGTLTRAQLAKIVVNAYQLKENTSNKVSFKDVNSSDWYYTYAKILGSHGINVGKSGYFGPNEPVTRADFAVIIKRTLDAMEE